MAECQPNLARPAPIQVASINTSGRTEVATTITTTQQTQTQLQRQALPQQQAFVSLIDVDVYGYACNWPLRNTTAASSAAVPISTVSPGQHQTHQELRATRAVFPMLVKDASMSSPDPVHPENAIDTRRIILPTCTTLKYAILWPLADDERAVYMQDFHRYRTLGTLYKCTYTPDEAFAVPETGIKKIVHTIKDKLTPSKSSDSTRVHPNTITPQDKIYTSLTMRATSSLRQLLNCYFITRNDCKLESLVANRVTLQAMFQCDMGRVFTIVDWMQLFQLSHVEPRSWLEALGYTFTLHREYPTQFSAQQHAVSMLRLTWAKDIRGAYGGFDTYDDLLESTSMLPAVDLAVLQFSLSDEVRHNTDLYGHGPAWGKFTKEVFMHMATYGCWTEKGAQDLGLDEEVARALELNTADFAELKWTHEFASKLNLPPPPQSPPNKAKPNAKMSASRRNTTMLTDIIQMHTQPSQ